MYFDFTSYFISNVIGKRNFDNRNWQFPLSRYVSICDEAFALLVFENNFDRWLDMAVRDDWTSSSVKPKYTTGGNANQTPKSDKNVSLAKKGKSSSTDFSRTEGFEENDPSTAMYQGWSMKGIKRFNELYDLVKVERESTLGSEFEDIYLQYCIEKNK